MATCGLFPRGIHIFHACGLLGALNVPPCAHAAWHLPLLPALFPFPATGLQRALGTVYSASHSLSFHVALPDMGPHLLCTTHVPARLHLRPGAPPALLPGWERKHLCGLGSLVCGHVTALQDTHSCTCFLWVSQPQTCPPLHQVRQRLAPKTRDYHPSGQPVSLCPVLSPDSLSPLPPP